MSKNDRYVVKHPKGWAVKGAGAERASSVHQRQADAERAAKQVVENAGGGEVRIQGRNGRGGIPIRLHLAMTRTRRATRNIRKRPPDGENRYERAN
ncbi:DUF2188 domain-containing protein [Pseudomonas aeruginosa]|uniref:DUF2188 domain-containing protein n=1 Tax=Pseudomonas aeruginosa TaxID=287 RepID=UPI003F527917